MRRHPEDREEGITRETAGDGSIVLKSHGEFNRIATGAALSISEPLDMPALHSPRHRSRYTRTFRNRELVPDASG